jgi:hypothetical protein
VFGIITDYLVRTMTTNESKTNILLFQLFSCTRHYSLECALEQLVSDFLDVSGLCSTEERYLAVFTH